MVGVSAAAALAWWGMLYAHLPAAGAAWQLLLDMLWSSGQQLPQSVGVVISKCLQRQPWLLTTLCETSYGAHCPWLAAQLQLQSVNITVRQPPAPARPYQHLHGLLKNKTHTHTPCALHLVNMLGVLCLAAAARCLDQYFELRVRQVEGKEAVDIDPRLVAVVERMLDRCVILCYSICYLML